MFRVDSSRFSNYPAYEFNLERLDFYQVGNKDIYIVCRAVEAPMTVYRQGARSTSMAGCMVQSRPRVVSFASVWRVIPSFRIMTRTMSMT